MTSGKDILEGIATSSNGIILAGVMGAVEAAEYLKDNGGAQGVDKNDIGDDNTMTEDIDTAYEGLEVDLTHEGAEVYRENQEKYDELTREQTQALGAANLLHRAAGGEEVEVDLDEAVEYVRENDLKEEWVDYKTEMPDIGTVQAAADEVIETVEAAEDYLDEAGLEASIYQAEAEEQSHIAAELATALDRVHETADSVETDDYTFAEDLRQSRENVLDPNEEAIQDALDNMDDRME